MPHALSVSKAALLCAVLAIASLLPAQSSPVELDRKTGEGEQCLVCGELIYGGGVVELRYKGRRFFVSDALLKQLFDDPDRYFQKMQVRSALFDEDAMPRSTSRFWLFVGLYAVAGMVFSALCGTLAISRSLPSLPWFFAGLFGNAGALVVLLFTPRGTPQGAPAGVPAGVAKVPATRQPLPCGSCGELNHPAALRCTGCGHGLEPRATSEVARLREAKP